MGMFDDAGIEPTEIPSDPYGFGKEYWPVEIIEVKPADVSKGGKQYGTMLKYKCLAEEYSWMESLGFGNWLQIPPPLSVVEVIPELKMDPKSDRGRKCIYNLGTLLKGLGIPADRMKTIKVEELQGMRCMAKIFPKQDDNGFWQFNIVGHKPMSEDGSDDMAVFAKGGNSAGSSGGMSDIDKALQDEMNASK